MCQCKHVLILFYKITIDYDDIDIEYDKFIET